MKLFSLRLSQQWAANINFLGFLLHRVCAYIIAISPVILVGWEEYYEMRS